ncbi:hypothetical protein [Paenibacillus pseudetheri]|uniref:Uncharacterized protein n=1 Tax=Paenibacillus pseudetheri TaxID=2897682 RepID=A0ABN8FVT2_9BACL|nr:hypothetical protein [Paenibacillus pseudetheri]CAH1059779.1 hypothetical protein PAECIP111894_05991 [Paenibacillus pseudetheri]
MATSPGDARLVTNVLYTQAFTYSTSSGELTNMVNKLVEIGLALSHPYVGTFMTTMGFFISPNEYQSYNNTSVTIIHDGAITQKIVEVYQWNGFQYIWAPMLTTQKKNTYASVYSVSWKGNVRTTSESKSIGLVSGQAAPNFYNSDASLTSLGKNTTSPLFYSYVPGTLVWVPSVSLPF